MNPAKVLIISAVAALVAHAQVPPARAADDLLAAIKSRGVIRACDVEYAPWNVRNPATNQWEGVNVDLLDLAAMRGSMRMPVPLREGRRRRNH